MDCQISNRECGHEEMAPQTSIPLGSPVINHDELGCFLTGVGVKNTSQPFP
jgi:hypothetical protein